MTDGDGTAKGAWSDPVDQAIIAMAHDALGLAVNREYEAAAKQVQAISDIHGGWGTTLAMTAWCDALILAFQQASPVPDDARVQVSFFDSQTGDASGSNVPDHIRWAGAVFAARADMDVTKFNALLDEVINLESAEVGRHVLGVLECVALTLPGVTIDAASAQSRHN
jgi:hypothetical protein